jgi:hypothetical protein
MPDPIAWRGILAATATLAAWLAVARAEPVNAVAGIRAVGSTVEIAVTSSEPFPVRALPPVLRIGEARFSRSRHPSDGSPHTLIFLVPIQEFELLNDGDPIRVGYGLAPGAPGTARSGAGQEWDLGRLDKQSLEP